MNHLFKGKPIAFLLSAVLCLSACGLTACKGDSSQVNSGSTNIAYSPTVPDKPIDPSVEGKKKDAGIGETVNFENKLTVTLNQVVELDASSSPSGRLMVAEFTIVNNGKDKIDCSTLTHFSASAEGTESIEIVRDTTAAIFARKYYTAIKSDMQCLNQPIQPGETVTGYVYVKTPSAWKDLKLIYIPYKYYTNDTILFDIDETKLTHYTESFK